MKIEETKLVKRALREAGYSTRVRHGTGTASGWLHIYIRDFDHDKADKVTKIAMDVTGRSGDCDGHINVFGIY